MEEINRIRDELVESELVENAKASFISNLVNPFSTRTNMVNTFAQDDFTKRPAGYWQNYVKNYEAVTPEAVLAAAQKYLHPDKLVFLVVGDPDAAIAGDDKHPDKYTDFGEVKIIPLRDPLTLK
jgi:predicted Zn-dependent peptidase